jgi:glycine oxidase
MADRVEVAIVGGGIVGCATAYFLAREGVSVAIIEKESVASGASGFSAGLLNPLHGNGIPGPIEALARESFKMHLTLAEEVREETGVDPEMHTMTSVWLAFDEEQASEFTELSRLAERLEDYSALWLDAQEVHSLEPRLSPRVTLAMCVEGLRHVTSYQYTLGLQQAAEKYGATIRYGTAVGLKRTNGHVSAVVLEDGELVCDKVVLAMGPWTGQAERWLGIRVPVGPLKGQILRLEVPGPPFRHTFYRSGGGYISPKPDGLIWVGTTEERVDFDDRPTPEARQTIMESVLGVLPGLSESKLALQTACLRPVSDDGLPIVGEAPVSEGVYVATGAGRKGILLGPAMARATADLVTSGRTAMPVESFSPARFARV